MIECQQPQAHPSRCGCEQEASAGRNVHASESGLPYSVRAASSASHRVSPAIIAGDPRLMKAESSAERTLRNLGYTDNGGELWKPPIGEKPNFSLIDALRQQLADVSNERDVLRADRDRIKSLFDALETDAVLLDYLQDQLVDTIYLDDGRIIDIAGRVTFREGVRAHMSKPAGSERVCHICRGEGRVGGPAPDEGGGKNCGLCAGTGMEVQS